MLLSLEDVSVYYGTAAAVVGINMEMEEGSMVGVIGANGAGKTTILRAISGLVPITSGKIWFSNRRIDTMATYQIVNLGIAHVPEGRRLFPYMSVLANLRLGAYLQKDKAGISRTLDNVFKLFPVLWERRNQQAGTMSGGEQQMLAIGRALMTNPKLLLMDEPSLGLAPLVINQLATVMTDINRSGVSVLLVEQNAGLVTKVTDRVYVLEVGRVVLEGNISELTENDAVRKAFLGT